MTSFEVLGKSHFTHWIRISIYVYERVAIDA